MERFHTCLKEACLVKVTRHLCYRNHRKTDPFKRFPKHPVQTSFNQAKYTRGSDFLVNLTPCVTGILKLGTKGDKFVHQELQIFSTNGLDETLFTKY